MSKTVTIQQQQPKSQIVKLKPPSVTTEISTVDSDDDETENYYANIINQFKTVIVDQTKEIDEKSHKLRVVEKAIAIKNEDFKRQINQKAAELKDKDIKIKLLEQEMQHHREKEVHRHGHRANTRKIVQELHDINSKRRDKSISEAQLDAEAREYLKMFE